MFHQPTSTRIPFPKNRFGSVSEVRDYDLAASRNTLLYPMQRTQELTMPHCCEGKVLLNLGCETGILAFMTSAHTQTTIIGIDEDPLFLQVANENLRLASLCDYPGNAKFILSKFHSLPFEDQSVDVVFADNFLYRVDNLLDVLMECRRIVRGNGVIILNQLIRDADKEKVKFINQYLKTDLFGGGKQFTDTLASCYSFTEYEVMIQEHADLGYQIRKEQMSALITFRGNEAENNERRA